LYFTTQEQIGISREANTKTAEALTYQRYRDSLNSIEQRREADSAHSIASRSVAVAERSLALNKKLVNIQERFAKVEVRARLVIQHWHVDKPELGVAARGRFVMKNLGKTPAFNVLFSHFLKIGTGLYQNEIDTMRTVAVRHLGTDYVDAGVEFGKEMKWEDGLTPYHMQLIENGQTVYYYGQVTYDDAFGKHHWTRFCFYYNADEKTTKTFFRGNESDNND